MPPKKKSKEPKAAAADPGEAQQQAFVRQALQSNVMALKERLKTVADDNEELRKTRSKVERDTHEFVAYFQTEMEKKDELIGSLKDRVVGLEYELRTQTKQIQDRLESEMRLRSDAAADVEARLRKELAKSEEEIYSLRAYRDNKDRLEAQVQFMRDELARKETEHTAAMEALERKFLEDKSRVLKAHAESFQETRRRAREDAQKQLDTDTKRIILDNKRMAEELKFQQEETEVLQKEKAEVEAQNVSLARELELLMEKDKEYAKLGVKRSTDNRDLSAKVKSLEVSLSRLTMDSERERKELISKTDEMVGDLKAEVAALHHLVKLKNKELRTIRRLAETILSQRTEVETYFLEALEQVKNDIRAQREAAKKATSVLRGGATSASLRLPSIKETALDRTRPASAGDDTTPKIELKDLSLEDRERVLRLLFAKINAVTNRGYRTGHEPASAPSQSQNQFPALEAGREMASRIGGPFGLAAPVPDAYDDV